MLDLCGREYVIEHCVNELRKDSHIKSYMVYVTDRLKDIVSGLGGKGLKRWIDLITPQKETRSAAEIVNDIAKSAGLKVRKKRNERIGDNGNARN